jgi:hypothetical protein
MELLGAGRDYKANSGNINRPRYVKNMNKAYVRFDRNNPTRPFTALPT